MVSLGIALCALGFVGIAALFTSHPGIPASTPPWGNILSVARTYLFRHALGNSILIVSFLTTLLFLAVRFAYAQYAAPAHSWYDMVIPPYVFAIAATPLFLPVPIAAFLWLPLYDRFDLLSIPEAALATILLVQAW